MPRLFKDPREINEPVMVKYHGAKGGRACACDQGWNWQIDTPLQDMGKAEIIRTGTALGVDYSLTTSCYNPDGSGRACGRCDSCALRKAGFAEAGVPDPTVYQES